MKKIISIIILMLSIVNINAINYKISNSGKNLIKKHESCSLTAYWDSNGYSIGYGHHKKSVYKGQTISQRQADKYFDEDIHSVETSVNKLIEDLPYDYRFSQGFIDGLCSLVYNCGEGSIRSSKFYRTLKNCRVHNGKMNKKDLAYTVGLVKNTKISSKGHIERRKNEMKIMLS